MGEQAGELQIMTARQTTPKSEKDFQKTLDRETNG
jgi:hypothetical protein